MVKRISAVFIILVFLANLFSCSHTRPDDVRAAFSKVAPKNEVFIFANGTFFIGNEEIPEEEYLANIDGYKLSNVKNVAIVGAKLYILVSKQVENDEHSVSVIEYDYLNQTSPVVVFNTAVTLEKHYSGGWDYYDGVFCIPEMSDGELLKNAYVISAGELIRNGYDDLSESRYHVKTDNEYFKITDSKTGSIKKIGNDIIKQSAYADAFAELNYYPEHAYSSGDTIILAYRIKSSAKGFNFFEPGYFYACFIFDFASEAIKFDSLLYPNDCEGIVIRKNIELE